MTSLPQARDTLEILIICDSRGKGLLNYLKDTEYDVTVKVYSGAKLYRSVKLAESEVIQRQPDQIYLLAGVNNITQLNKRTREVDLMSMNKDKIVQNFVDEMNFSFNLLRKITAEKTKIIFAPITGMDLERYNNVTTGSMIEKQNILNESIIEVNNLIIAQNTSHGYRTPWTHGIVHRYFRRKYHFAYDRLTEDGCHLTDRIKEYWGKKITTAIVANI